MAFTIWVLNSHIIVAQQAFLVSASCGNLLQLLPQISKSSFMGTDHVSIAESAANDAIMIEGKRVSNYFYPHFK